MNALDRFKNLDDYDLPRLAAGEAIVHATLTSNCSGNEEFSAPGDDWGRIGTAAYRNHGPEVAAKVAASFVRAYNLAAADLQIPTITEDDMAATMGMSLSVGLEDAQIAEVREAFRALAQSSDED